MQIIEYPITRPQQVAVVAAVAVAAAPWPPEKSL